MRLGVAPAFDFIQRRLMLAMAVIYVLGGLAPSLGVAMRHVRVLTLPSAGGAPFSLTLPGAMLALTLFNAGLGVGFEDLGAMLRRPAMLLVGVGANMVMPLGFLAIASLLLRAWPEGEEAQHLLVGLALIGAMPVAGGATVWTQNADGDVPLSVGLVLVSGLLSPLTIPLSLRAVSHFTKGDLSEDLVDAATHGSATFALVSVVVPCALGILVRRAVGKPRLASAMPWIKRLNLVNILALSYSNASSALHAVFQRPDLDMLGLVVLTTAAMCGLSFWVGWVIAVRMRASAPTAISLTFGVGMNNSSASAVLATTSMADHSLVLLPILAYSMLQKFSASGVDAVLRRRARAELVAAAGGATPR